jgi:queuine tRNA-ribosyltransferase
VSRGKYSFEILTSANSNEPRPRLGRLAIQGRKELPTPNYLAITSRGVVPHISPDVLSSQTQIGGVHLALEDCES